MLLKDQIMLISILAVVGLYFIILIVYRKGRKEGIKDTIDYITEEMKKKEMEADAVVIEEKLEVFDKTKHRSLIPFFVRSKNHGR